MATESSLAYEQQWVMHGLYSIGSIIQVEATPTIFLVAKELKETLAEAYTPQRLGLGAYHHLSPNLHVGDRQKRAVVKEIIYPGFPLEKFMRKMENLQPVIRSNYDNFLNLQTGTFIYIMAIDSLYLIAFLQCYRQNRVDLVHKTLAKDVLKLENQIPARALTLAGNRLGIFLDSDDDVSSSSSRRRSTKLYAEFFYSFCTAHSPLKLAQLRRNLRKKSKHLLAHLYYLIVNNQGLQDGDDDHNHGGDEDEDDDDGDEDEDNKDSDEDEDYDHGDEGKDEDEDDDDKAEMPKYQLRKERPPPVAYLQPPPGMDLENTVLRPFRTVQAIHEVWKSSRFVNYIFNQEEEENKVEKIQIPSASELSKKFNVDFMTTPGGIRGIRFQSTEEGGSGAEANKLYLPEIKLESDSEVVLRNLVAYEAALFATHPGSKLELTDYVDLMCGIVDTTEDVTLLRNKGIIEEGGLSDEKIAEMFNGINRSTAGGEQEEEEKSESKKAVEEVKEMVEELESKMMWKRACKFCNKIVKSTKELLVKKPAIIAMKYLTTIFLAALLILQILQAYCDIYDCSRKESQKTNVAARLMSVI